VKLYDNRHAPNPRRVRIFLAEKGVEIPTVQVDLLKREHKSEEFRRRNPLGSIPVLELDDGECIAESVAICRYLEELHPEPSLFGRDARERARVEMWNRRVELGLLMPVAQVWLHGSPLTAPVMKAQGAAQIAEAAAFHRRVIARFLAWLDGELAGREFLAGNLYSVADVTALCTLDFATGLVGVEVDPALAELARWHAAVSARPSARA
jgi:glutathione S-transferase